MGKIGKDSPTFIQPVSERSDGIKSFFQKQNASPAKPKVKSEASSAPRPLRHEEDEEEKDKTDLKEEAEGIKAEVTAKDEELGLGDDSNAPNPGGGVKAEEATLAEKREDDEKQDTSTTLTKRRREEKGGAGHRTKVLRKDSGEEGNQAVSRIEFERCRPALPAPSLRLCAS